MSQTEHSTSPKNVPTGGSDSSKSPQKHRTVIIRIALIAIVVGGLIVFQIYRNLPEGRWGYLRVNGRIEGYEVNVGAKIAGRVEYISNREGEEVKRGQLLVKLSDEDIQAQLRGAEARRAEADQSVLGAQDAVRVSEHLVDEAKLNLQQSKQDTLGRVDQATANAATADAQLHEARAQEIQAQADLELARVRKKRYDDLVAKGAVTQDEDDQARTTYDTQMANVDAKRAAVVAAQRQLASAQGALVQAKSTSFNPPIRRTQEKANRGSLAQNKAALERAKLDIFNATAAVDEIKANIVYLNIPSPIHGVVTARTVEPGAVVAAGQTVISLIDLDTVFLRAYVPDSQIGKVRINQKAFVYYDSNPHHGVEGKVIEIDPQASFTPENIYFRDDRVKQVFGIKIMIDNPGNFAKPGMPADADIDITSGVKQN